MGDFERQEMQLLDAIEDAQTEVDRYQSWLRNIKRVQRFSIGVFIGGWITGIGSGYVGINAAWLTAGMFLISLMCMGGSLLGLDTHVARWDGQWHKNPQDKLHAAERNYRAFIMQKKSD